ncbi:hypothetical protein FACS1894182_11200 [Bacteroidia bacterium]|nr:hypothetical protein FACS1894182_11200 [Bacteroidia bacterium]
MKKLFLGLSLLAIANVWTGCSKEESIEAPVNVISFRVQGGTPQLRTTGVTVDHVDAFTVYGTDDSKDFGGNATSAFIFDGVTVARQQNGTFDYSPKRFFGENASQSVFFAYSPVSAIANGLTPSVDPASGAFAAGSKLTYVLPVPDKTGLVTQQDLLVSGVDPSVSPSGTTMVTLNFEHALARVFVKAKNTTAKEGDVVVKSLTLKGLKNEAEIQINSDATWKWAAHTVPGDLNYILADGGVSVPSGGALATAILLTSMEQGMMVIPQKTVNGNKDAIYAAGDFALEVKYDLGYNLKDQVKYIKLTDEYEFESGKQYNILITFSGSAIEFTVTVTPWENPVDAPVL